MLQDLPRIDEFALLKLGKSTITLGGLAAGIAIVVLAFIAARFLAALIGRVRVRSGRSAPSLYIVEKLVTYGLVIFGIVAGLSTLGLNLSSLAVFAGALGVGVGLGLQGVVKEFVSGLVLIFDRVLNVGDYIEMESGTRGLVQEIGPRATRIRTNDNVDILIPNSKLIENPVINWTLRGEGRRIHVPFVVAIDADKEVVREAVVTAGKAVPFTLPDDGARRTQVWMVGYGEGYLKFELVVWPTLDAVKRPQAMNAAYTWAIDDALRDAQVEVPYPQRELRLRGLFGDEGEDAQRALRLVRRRRTAREGGRHASINDAADDLLTHEEPPEPPKPA